MTRTEYRRMAGFIPDCAALQRDSRGRALCAMCDQHRFIEARRSYLALRRRKSQ